LKQERAEQLLSIRPWLFVASPLTVLLVWELAARFALLDARFFPPPTRIGAEIARLFVHDTLVADILASMRRIGLGLLIGFFPGVALGLAMGLWSWVRSVFAPLVALTYPIPKIAILPLLLIVFGLGEMSNIMVVAIGVFFLGLINTYAGVRRIPKVYFDVAKVYRISRPSVLLKVVIPACFPDIFTGLRLSVGYGLILIVAAEMVAADSGLGYRIWMSWETYVIPELYACLAVIGLLGVLLAVVLEKAEDRIIHWKRA
jgi:ABC-type nitrate/sulfonate/bicarbonate transport system permease component